MPVDHARAHTDLSAVTRVAIDETSARRGHNHITLFVDIDQARVVFATPGKDAETAAAFADDLTAHRGHPAAVAEVCINTSRAFIAGTAEHLPGVPVTFDKYHAVKVIKDAVDRVQGQGKSLRNCGRGPATSGCAISQLLIPYFILRQ